MAQPALHDTMFWWLIMVSVGQKDLNAGRWWGIFVVYHISTLEAEYLSPVSTKFRKWVFELPFLCLFVRPSVNIGFIWCCQSGCPHKHYPSTTIFKGGGHLELGIHIFLNLEIGLSKLPKQGPANVIQDEMVFPASLLLYFVNIISPCCHLCSVREALL